MPFTAADGVPVLLYHKVGTYPSGGAIKAHYVAPTLFRAHLSWLADAGYRTLGSDDLARYLDGQPLPVERPLVITFDDGYDCIHAHAAPALQEFGFGAIVFVLAGHIGGVNDWEPRMPAALEPMLSAAHIAQLAAQGFEFGSHGLEHHPLSRVSASALAEELAQSRRILEDLTGRQVRAVAYPLGEHNHRVRQAAAEAGYALGFTTEHGVNRPGADPLALRRINIRRYSYLPLFRRKLWQAYGAPRRRG